MISLSDDEQRELYTQVFRRAHSEFEFLMDCLVALQLSAQVCNDDQVAQLAKDGLAACQPIPEILGQLQAYLGLTKVSREDGVLKTIPRFRTDAERTLVSRK